MNLPDILAAPQWILPAVALVAVAGMALLWSYLRSDGGTSTRMVALFCKLLGISLLAFCLLEPTLTVDKPKKGANLLMILADASQSLQVRDLGQTETREQQLRRALVENQGWQQQAEEDFELRRYTFDRQLRSSDFTSYRADGIGSSISHALKTVVERYRGRPTAGILLFSDGNATDIANSSINWSAMPPVYPVIVGSQKSAKDVSISRFHVGQTNFETAPVNITAELRCQGYTGRSITAQLIDAEGQVLGEQIIAGVQDDQPFVLRFQLRPEQRGISTYRVRAYAQGQEYQFDDPESISEATLVNNERMILVDRAGGPYRVLYVCGRPNWEFKFMRRAIADDDEIELVGLIRIAKKEPKFTFRSHRGESTNPLFRGFDNQQDEQAEQYDEPVLIRIGTRDREELRDGFPKSAEELFQYHAIILDDVEASFFNEDQKSLLQNFVSARGGGLLVLGGQESYVQGKFDRTPIGEMLPVYLDRITPVRQSLNADRGDFRLQLTREGWLQPWVRIEATESEENKRLATMPGFKTLNTIASIKPGASVLARVSTGLDQILPALVVQRFGKGRTGAVLIGDLWRWHLANDQKNDDLMKAWRQMVRWLVAEVPRSVDVEIEHRGDANLTVDVNVRVNDASFKPLDNADVNVTFTKPDGSEVTVAAEPSDAEPGIYGVSFVPRDPGAYRLNAIAKYSDGTMIMNRRSGWVSEPAGDEFESLKPNRAFLQQIADRTGGQVYELSQLSRLVSKLPTHRAPVMETRIYPWWHHWPLFCLAIALLVSEWGIRRWKGLA